MNLSCYLCGSVDIGERRGRVRDNSSIKILECRDCGLVFLSSFSHINDKFYENSGMHNGSVDLQLWIKQTAPDDERRYAFLSDSIAGKSILDFGCGNGQFLIKVRKESAYVCGVELENCLASYFHKEALDVFPNLDKIDRYFDFITLFHVLEHIPDPKGLLVKLAQKLNKKGEIIVEVPNANDALLTIYRNVGFSNFTYWGCHLFLFTENNLKQLAHQTGLKINYIKQVQRYPLSNHLFWLAEGKPGGHEQWSFLDSDELNMAYSNKLASLKSCDTIVASFSTNEDEI